MQLHNLKPAPGSRRKKVIIGRGEGSTLGQTAGRGQKGQSARTGETIMVGFEGGQTPLVRRIPKRGFNSPDKIHYQPINVGALEAQFDAGAEINGDVLAKKGFLKRAEEPFKILGDGKLTKKFAITATRFSKSAEKAVKAAGGSLSLTKKKPA
jgi:large subunit ribosomal protein L15